MIAPVARGRCGSWPGEFANRRPRRSPKGEFRVNIRDRKSGASARFQRRLGDSSRRVRRFAKGSRRARRTRGSRMPPGLGYINEGAPRLWTVGPPSKSVRWEITAVPEIRIQAQAVAEAIAQDNQDGPLKFGRLF